MKALELPLWLPLTLWLCSFTDSFIYSNLFTKDRICDYFSNENETPKIERRHKNTHDRLAGMHSPEKEYAFKKSLMVCQLYVSKPLLRRYRKTESCSCGIPNILSTYCR